MKGPPSKTYEIVRPWDDGYDIWDAADTLQAAEKICSEMDNIPSIGLDRPYKHRIYEVTRRLVSKAERAKALKRKPKGKVESK